MADLKAGRTEELEYALRFLEADPWCFRSGYTKARLVRALLHLELDDETCRRLRGALLTAIDDPHQRREYREYVRLACRLAGPELTAALQSRLASPHDHVRRNAQAMLDAIGSSVPA